LHVDALPPARYMQMVFKDVEDESTQQELLYMMMQEQQRLQVRML